MNKSKHYLYKTWINMNKASELWNTDVCKRWSNFWKFVEDVGNRPTGLYLFRKDLNKMYSPSNIKWMTRKEFYAILKKHRYFTGRRGRGRRHKNISLPIHVYEFNYTKSTNKYRVMRKVNGELITYGYFKTIEECLEYLKNNELGW